MVDKVEHGDQTEAENLRAKVTEFMENDVEERPELNFPRTRRRDEREERDEDDKVEYRIGLRAKKGMGGAMRA